MAVEPLSYPDEIWKPVIDPRLNDNLEASDYGRVRRLSRTINVVSKTGHCQPHDRHIPTKILKDHFKKKYLHVAVNYVGRKGDRGIPVHILICAAFNGPPPSDKHQVAHLDNIAENITPGNLRWATAKENNADKIRHGTHQAGEKNGRAIVDAFAVAEIRALYVAGGIRQVDLAKRYGLTQATISQIILRKSWTHVS